nr:MAG: hypothetical protein H1BulkLitter55069_000003 [Mitovirus sp.]
MRRLVGANWSKVPSSGRSFRMSNRAEWRGASKTCVHQSVMATTRTFPRASNNVASFPRRRGNLLLTSNNGTTGKETSTVNKFQVSKTHAPWAHATATQWNHTSGNRRKAKASSPEDQVARLKFGPALSERYVHETFAKARPRGNRPTAWPTSHAASVAAEPEKGPVIVSNFRFGRQPITL